MFRIDRAIGLRQSGRTAPGLSRPTDQPSHFGSPQQADFDIVGFDPRTVGHSAPITCLSDTQLDHYFALDPSPLSGSACASASGVEDVADAVEGVPERVVGHVDYAELAVESADAADQLVFDLGENHRSPDRHRAHHLWGAHAQDTEVRGLRRHSRQSRVNCEGGWDGARPGK